MTNFTLKWLAVIVILIFTVHPLSYCQDTLEENNKEKDKQEAEEKNEIENQEMEEENGERKDVEKRSHFRYRIYSDFVGIEDDQPNGLIQTEVYWSWRLINKPVIKHDNFKLYFMYNFVAPDLALLKVDEKERYLPVLFVEGEPDGEGKKPLNAKALNTIDLVRYANIRTSAKLNLFTLSFPNSRILLDSYVLSYRTAIRDSTRKEPERNLNSFGGGFNILFHSKVFEDSNFKFDIGYSIYWLKLFTNTYKQIQSSDENDDRNVIPLRTTSFRIQPLTSFYSQVVYANAEKENKTEYFLRISYNTNFISVRTPDYFNGFVQFQVGLSKNIDFKQLIGKDSDDNSDDK